MRKEKQVNHPMLRCTKGDFKPLLNGLFLLLITALPLLAHADNMAPNFTLPTQQGSEITLSDLKGKVVYLDFWASWCGPCRRSFPWMNQLHKESDPEQFQIIAINLDSEEALAKKFLSNLPADFIVAFDPNGDTAKAYQLPGMPTSYLIDRDGRVISRHIGFLERDSKKIEQQIQQLLDKKG